MDSVKRAQKIMMVLVIIPGCLCVVGIVAYFATDRGGMSLVSCPDGPVFRLPSSRMPRVQSRHSSTRSSR